MAGRTLSCITKAARIQPSNGHILLAASHQALNPDGHKAWMANRFVHNGLNSNWKQKRSAQSRGRLISRLDRILDSPNAINALSTEQLTHIQYLRDFWAGQDVEQSTSERHLRQIDVMTHETKEVLGRYSAQVGQGSVTANPRNIPMGHDSLHRQRLKKVERLFGENARVLTQQMMPFKTHFLVWVAVAALGVPILFLFEWTLTWLFPDKAKALEAAEKRRYQEAHEMFYDTTTTSQPRR